MIVADYAMREVTTFTWSRFQPIPSSFRACRSRQYQNDAFNVSFEPDIYRDFDMPALFKCGA